MELNELIEKCKALAESRPGINKVRFPNKVKMTPEDLMIRGMELMKSKSHDYTTGDRYENFIRQGELISWFKDPVDRAFVSVIAIKLARLASLLGRDKEPKNESVQDTFVDLTNYCALWGGYRTSRLELITKSTLSDIITD